MSGVQGAQQHERATPHPGSPAPASNIEPLPPVPAGTHPPNDAPSYGSTRLRHPRQPLVAIPQTLSERTGPSHRAALFGPLDADLTRQHAGAPLGERIVLHGSVRDESGRPVRDALVEIWQANAAGRYAHERDQHDAPLDPCFSGAGRLRTDGEGRYRFVTIRPGAYPWQNHANAWRPAHVHFSLFGGCALTRLVTQMYFPGDPLLALDPIFQAVPDAAARERLVARFDLDATEPGWALGYRFDLVVRGRSSTPFETRA
jgi:protocatechuate 3,4-dioxygenase, beta subunit